MYGGNGDSKEDAKTLYFFTRRRRLSFNSKRFYRKVGSGSWSVAQNLNKVFDFYGVVIAIKREFCYEGGSDSLHNCAWLMQEYEMVDDHSDLVLCALRKSPRFEPPAPQTSSSSVPAQSSSTIIEKTKKRKTQPGGKPEPKKQKKKVELHMEPQGTTDDDYGMQLPPHDNNVNNDFSSMLLSSDHNPAPLVILLVRVQVIHHQLHIVRLTMIHLISPPLSPIKFLKSLVEVVKLQLIPTFIGQLGLKDQSLPLFQCPCYDSCCWR